ncbi:MAG: Flp pilus assembly protein CpaB [Proteobacteria bacterium]|nr:MAG: Flp pilus assembly protein CpaB [Pseudomonadota bacterium]
MFRVCWLRSEHGQPREVPRSRGREAKQEAAPVPARAAEVKSAGEISLLGLRALTHAQYNFGRIGAVRRGSWGAKLSKQRSAMPVRSSSKTLMRRRVRGFNFAAIIIGACIVSAALIVTSRRVEFAAAQRPAPVVAEFDTIKIPVPIELVPAGTKVKNIKLREVSFPKHQIPLGALKTLAAHTDTVTTAVLPANLPIFEVNLTKAGYLSNPVLEKIPPGMRAMTIRVDATSAVEGWAGSGSIVDVLLVEKERTSVIAEKVKVLSAERSVSPVEGASAPNVPSTVTLLVTQEQCLAINTAIPLGKIAFALRSTRDEESWDNTSFTSDKLKGASASQRRKSSINGYISVKDEAGERTFALADGKWIKSEVVPQGFMVAQNR